MPCAPHEEDRRQVKVASGHHVVLFARDWGREEEEGEGRKKKKM